MQDPDNFKENKQRKILRYGAGIPSERKLAGDKRLKAWRK